MSVLASTHAVPDTAPASPPTTRAQRIAHAALWLYLLSPLLLMPLSTAADALDGVYLLHALASLLWAGILIALVRRPFVLHLALLPLYVTTTVDLFLIRNFGGRLSSSYVGIMLTDHGELGEFIATYGLRVLPFALAMLLVYLPALWLLRPVRLRRWPVAAAVSALLLVGAYGVVAARSLSHGATVPRALVAVVDKEMSAPMGAVFQSSLAIYKFNEASAFFSQRRNHSFHAQRAAGREDEVYVWVIGESSRPHNWSLFGYRRDTTPQLRATPGLLPLTQVMTTAPVTATAVPSMLSLKPIGDWAGILATKSVVGAFEEVGFETHWLSLQEADSWAGFIPQVAAEAQHRRYFTAPFDGVLLDEVRELLQRRTPGKPMFIVLHTKGSHFEYSRRVPDGFGPFRSSVSSPKAQLVDAYDNSVAYTDWFLANLIRLLRDHVSNAALVYSSDHGENLKDDAANLLGHSIGNRYDLPVAAFLWLSDGLAARTGDPLQQALRHADAPISISNLPHSLLDLAGIQADGLDPTMSLFNARFAPRPRSWVVKGALYTEPALAARAKTP